MPDTTPACLAARLTAPLLLLAAACFAMPFAVLPGGGVSGLDFALANHAATVATGGAHPETTVALVLLLIALGVSWLRIRHRISLLVLASGFATCGLLLLRATLATAAQDSADGLATSLGGGQTTFDMLGGALQQILAVRWTAAYWVALLAAGAVFALNSWALLRQPVAPRPAVRPLAEPHSA